jgi:hypothetical protein
MPRIKYEGDGAVFIGSFLEENEFAFIHWDSQLCEERRRRWNGESEKGFLARVELHNVFHRPSPPLSPLHFTQ